MSNDINDYHIVAQGKTVIAGVDDGEEMRLTDVSPEIDYWLSSHSLSLSLSFFFIRLTACCLKLRCVSAVHVCQKILVFAEITMLSNRITDYPLISQGKTRIPGVNDAQDLELTVVSHGLAWSVRVASDIREHINANKISDKHVSCPLLARVPKGFMHRFFILKTPFLAPALAQTNTHVLNTGRIVDSIRVQFIASFYLIW